jgi:rubrerythrin
MKEALRQAMKAEIEGRELYKAAAQKTGDEKAREVFTFLAGEEDSHLQALQQMYRDQGKGEVQVPGLSHSQALRQDSPIFSEDFRNRLKGKHFEMSALSIAVKLEKDSFEYYGKMSEEAAAPELADFFLMLSDWEKEHYEMLNREISLLEDEYFKANNFEPF